METLILDDRLKAHYYTGNHRNFAVVDAAKRVTFIILKIVEKSIRRVIT